MDLLGTALIYSKSWRTAQNKVYMVRAIRVLGYGRRFAWLGLGSKKRFRAGEAKLRATVLAELGRFGFAPLIRHFARALCRLQPATVTAVALLRKRRRGVRFSNPEHLARRMFALIDRHRQEHPELTAADAGRAVAMVSRAFRAQRAFRSTAQRGPFDLDKTLHRTGSGQVA